MLGFGWLDKDTALACDEHFELLINLWLVDFVSKWRQHVQSKNRQRLIEKAARRNKKSKRLQRKIQREIEKKSPNMARITKW